MYSDPEQTLFDWTWAADLPAFLRHISHRSMTVLAEKTRANGLGSDCSWRGHAEVAHSTLASLKRGLADFCHRYSANLMRLVVYGRESIAELCNLVESKFASVLNKNLPAPEFSGTLPGHSSSLKSKVQLGLQFILIFYRFCHALILTSWAPALNVMVMKHLHQIFASIHLDQCKALNNDFWRHWVHLW